MFNSYVGNAGQFLISTLFGAYILILLLRLLLQYFRADFYNPVSQFIVKVTQPVLQPIRRVVSPLGGLDSASLLLMLVLKVVELKLVLAMLGHTAGLGGLLVLAVAALISLTLDVFFWAILAQVIISWVNPGMYNPMVGLLRSLTEPLLAPARRIIPPMGGLDLSPIVVIILLKLTDMLAVAPFRDVGASLL